MLIEMVQATDSLIRDRREYLPIPPISYFCIINKNITIYVHSFHILSFLVHPNGHLENNSWAPNIPRLIPIIVIKSYNSRVTENHSTSTGKPSISSKSNLLILVWVQVSRRAYHMHLGIKQLLNLNA